MKETAGTASFRVPVYGGKVVVCVSREAHNKLHTELDGSPYKGVHAVVGLTSKHATKDQRTVYLVGVFEGGMQTLVHELIHACFYILHHAGVPISPRNDEAFAYLMDSLYHDAVEAMKQARRRKR